MPGQIGPKDGTHTWYTAKHELKLRRPPAIAALLDVDVSTTPPAYGDALVWVDADKKWEPGSVGGSLLPCTTQSASYTLVLADAETCVEFTAAGAVNCTIPPNSSVAFPVGAWVQVRQFGAGQVTFVAGSGVTLRSPASRVKTCQQYTTITAHQRAADEWVLIGDLV